MERSSSQKPLPPALPAEHAREALNRALSEDMLAHEPDPEWGRQVVSLARGIVSHCRRRN